MPVALTPPSPDGRPEDAITGGRGMSPEAQLTELMRAVRTLIENDEPVSSWLAADLLRTYCPPLHDYIVKATTNTVLSGPPQLGANFNHGEANRRNAYIQASTAALSVLTLCNRLTSDELLDAQAREEIKSQLYCAFLTLKGWVYDSITHGTAARDRLRRNPADVEYICEALRSGVKMVRLTQANKNDVAAWLSANAFDTTVTVFDTGELIQRFRDWVAAPDPLAEVR